MACCGEHWSSPLFWQASTIHLPTVQKCRTQAPVGLPHIAGTAACCGSGARVIRRSCPRTAMRTRWDASTAMWEGSARVARVSGLRAPWPYADLRVHDRVVPDDLDSDDRGGQLGGHPRPPAVLGPGQVAWSRPAGKNHGLARGEPPVPADREPPDLVRPEIADPPLAAGLGTGGRSTPGGRSTAKCGCERAWWTGSAPDPDSRTRSVRPTTEPSGPSARTATLDEEKLVTMAKSPVGVTATWQGCSPAVGTASPSAEQDPSSPTRTALSPPVARSCVA